MMDDSFKVEVKKSGMNNGMRNAVLQFLRCNSDKLEHGAILAALKEFNVHRRTISRLWKQAKLSKISWQSNFQC